MLVFPCSPKESPYSRFSIMQDRGPLADLRAARDSCFLFPKQRRHAVHPSTLRMLDRSLRQPHPLLLRVIPKEATARLHNIPDSSL